MVLFQQPIVTFSNSGPTMMRFPSESAVFTFLRRSVISSLAFEFPEGMSLVQAHSRKKKNISNLRTFQLISRDHAQTPRHTTLSYLRIFGQQERSLTG